MKYLICLSVLITAFLYGYSQEDIILQKTKFERVNQAYGYLLGQEYSLDRIKNRYPDLSMQVLTARTAFGTSFKLARTNITDYLKNFYGTKYNDVDAKLNKKIDSTISLVAINKADAVSFIIEVKKRSTGKITSPILETLLSFEYQDRPEEELSAGSYKVFNTKGHPKSKNTDWQIKFPKSWCEKEGIRPNIIKVLTSDYGSGLESVTLMVKDLKLPKGTKISQNEILAQFSENGLKQGVPNGARFISGKRITLDNYVGGMLVVEQKMERVDITVKMRIIQFSFYRDGKIYMLQCGIMGKENENLDMRYGKFLPLYKLMANSIVVNDQFK
jgi:hypothetical protein